jgi:hypothetical protein
MSTIRSLIVRIGADLTQFERGMRQMEKSLLRTGKSMQKIGKDMTRYVTLPILAAGTAAVKMAMDAFESENLFEVSMGNMAKAARDWSEELRKQLGLNSYEVRRNVSTFNVMFDSMGVSATGAYEMAKGLTQLSYDMASFYNLKPEEAFTKLQAGISGETVPLKRLGILVDETTTKTYAYTKGIAAQGAELSQQQKLLARYGSILEQTSKAQGDLARTLDSPINKLRIMTANVQQMAIEIGMKLIPIFEKLLGHVNSLITAFSKLSDAQQHSIIKFAMMAAVAGPIISLFGKIATGAAGVLNGIGQLGSWFSKLGAVTIPAATAALKTFIGTASGLLAALSPLAYLGIPLGLFDDPDAKGYREYIDKMAKERREAYVKQKQIALGIVDQSGGRIETDNNVVDWWSDIINSAQAFGDTASQAMDDFAASIRGVIDEIRSQTRAFAEFTGLFDVFERKHISGDRLMKRLQAQVRAMSEWQNSLVAIQAKGVSEQFLNALRMQGPGAVDQINALARMSPDQLRQYEGLYRQKYDIGGQQAVWANQAGRVENNEINLYITGNNISNEQDAARLANQIIGQLRLAGYGI